MQHMFLIWHDSLIALGQYLVSVIPAFSMLCSLDLKFKVEGHIPYGVVLMQFEYV